MGLFFRRNKSSSTQGGQSVTGLALPTRLAPGPNSFDANPKRVAQWVENLPLANIGQTSRELYRAIREINRTNIPVVTRIKASEQLRRPMHYVADNLERHFIGPALPLTEKTRKISRLHRELWIEMGLAYRITLDDLLGNDGRSADKKLLAVALHRSLFYASQLILDLTQTYHVVPSKIWRELHMLYLLAEKNNLHLASVNDPEISDEDKRTVSELYKRVLLFMTADPYSLSQPDIKRVYAFLRQYADRASIQDVDTAQDYPNQSFIIDLWSNKPPQHARLFKEKKTRTQRVLQTASIADWLQNHFDSGLKPSDAQLSGQPSQRLLRKLLQRWGTGPKRHLTRTSMGMELALTTGLATIHRLLTGDHSKTSAQAPNELAFESNIYQGRPDPWANLENMNLSMEPIANDKADQFSYDQDTLPLDGLSTPSIFADSRFTPHTEKTDPSIPSIYTCRSENESAGGYCVNWTGKNIPKIKIGELIGITSPKSPEIVGVSICRWIKVRSHDDLHLGMQVIAPKTVACKIALAESDMEAAPALLVPEMRAANRQASLLTDTMPFEVGKVVRVRTKDSDKSVRLTRLLESSGSFRQFQFVDVDEAGAVETSASEEEFTGLWEAL